MVRSKLLRSGSLFLGAFLLASCSDPIPTGPTESIEGSSISAVAVDQQASRGSGKLGSGVDLKGMWWEKHHKKEFSASRTIGSAGGTISIPETGLSVSFPAGALTSDVKITVTSDRKYVAYKFEPEGTRFERDVVVTQSLRNTELYGRPLRVQLFVAYIADDKLSGKIEPLELVPTHTIFSPLSPLFPEAQVWIIRHFSRYMLASG